MNERGWLTCIVIERTGVIDMFGSSGGRGKELTGVLVIFYYHNILAPWLRSFVKTQSTRELSSTGAIRRKYDARDF